MRLSKTSLTIAVPLAALAIAGCGGGGDDDSTSTPATVETTALSRADLISQGDAICAEVNKAVGAAEITSAGESAELTVKIATLYTGMVDSIKGLGEPAEAAGYPEFIVTAEALSGAQAEAKLAAEREDVAALEEAMTKASSAEEEFESAAAEYGFEECGEGPSAPTAAPGTAPVEEAEEGGLEAAPEEIEEEAPIEEVAPEELPETGGAGGGVEEAAPETGGGSTGGSSGGVGPG